MASGKLTTCCLLFTVFLNLSNSEFHSGALGIKEVLEKCQQLTNKFELLLERDIETDVAEMKRTISTKICSLPTQHRYSPILTESTTTLSKLKRTGPTSTKI